MDPYDNYIDLQLENPSMDYLKKKGDARFEDLDPADRKEEEPIFFDHFQTLVRTMEMTRK